MILVASLLIAMQQAPLPVAPPPPPPDSGAAAKLDFAVYRQQIEPILLKKRAGNVTCATCHAGGASSQLRLQPLAEGATGWTEEQSRQNLTALARFVVPGQPLRSRLLRHPLERHAGGDPFHGGGKHFETQSDPEWQALAHWVNGEKYTMPAVSARAARFIQTNAAGDNAHVIDPATNRVVGIIEGIPVAHGVVVSPDGSRIYISDEPQEELEVIDAKTLKSTKSIKLSGRPNNLTVSKDGRRVYVGIAEAPGAIDIIDAVTLTRVKSVPVQGGIHNIYSTPDGNFVVSGSVGSSVITVLDQKTETIAWTTKLSAGIRPMAFVANDDGSTKSIIVQLSNFHGFAVVDFKTHEEVARVEHPAIPGIEAHWDGLQAAPAHGLMVSPDRKTLWSTSKVYGYAYAYSLPDLKPLGGVEVGQHPEWVSQTSDGHFLYIAAAGDNSVTVVDANEKKVVAHVPVGQVPKRNVMGMLQTN